MSKMFLTFAAVFLALSGAANPGLADQVGSPTVMSGDVLEVAGRRFHLYGMIDPVKDSSS
jgi:hypothetical protein